MSVQNFFKDKQGKVVIAQWPNWPLWVALIFFFLQFLPVAIIQTISFWGVMISLLYWSYLEIVSGVNRWRQLLGVIVAISQILKLIRLVIV